MLDFLPCFHMYTVPEYMAWPSVWPLLLSSSPWVCSKLKLAAGTVRLDAVHKWVQPGRPAPGRCAKCSVKKCFTHFCCVTCWFHTFQLCYLLTRNYSVVSLDCSNWITVEPELAQTGMRKSLPLLAVLKHQLWDCASDEVLVLKCETVVPFICTMWKGLSHVL